jgi:SAM-dependent methyltransferase
MTYKDFIEKLLEMKNSGKGLMSEKQYASIGYLLKMFDPCNLLIFGLGHDSFLWNELNGGKTVFIEDDEDWIGQFKGKNLDIRKITYTTQAKDHDQIGFDSKILKLNFDDDIEKTTWDVIIVDAPLGHGPPGRDYKGPGRMQSIYNAYRLLRPGGICIVDDMKRHIEQKYSLGFFGEENIINLVEDKVCFFKKDLRHFNNLRNHLTGKKVAVVGPAAYMMNSGLGKEIDQHDVVVRINRGLDSINHYKEDVGTKTDILYSSLIEEAQHAGDLSVDKLKEHGTRWIITPPSSGVDGVCHSESFHELVDHAKIDLIKKEIPVTFVSKELNNDLVQFINCKPNTGFLAIYDLLQYDLESLSVYGFSFFLDGYIKDQKSGLEKEKNCTVQEYVELAFNSKRHVQKNIWSFAKKLLLNNKKVKLDSTLEKILSLENFSREELQNKLTSTENSHKAKFPDALVNIGIDFDGVIHKCSKGYHDGTIYDDPVQGVHEALKILSQNHKLVVYTCKAKKDRGLVNGKTGAELVWEWLKKHDLAAYVSEVTAEKPRALIYIDDNALKFNDWSSCLAELKNKEILDKKL